MIFLEQVLMLKLGEVPFGQAMAETPNWALLNDEFTRKTRVEACRVPVEPRSTSPSPLPNTDFPTFCRSPSMMPRKVGVEPKGPVHRWVPKGSLNSHCRPVMAMVPFGPIEMAGSLSPSGTV